MFVFASPEHLDFDGTEAELNITTRQHMSSDLRTFND